MVDGHREVVALPAGGPVEAGERDVRVGFAQGHVDGMAGDVAAEHERRGLVAGLLSLHHLGVSDVGGPGGFGLHPVVGERGGPAEPHGRAGVGQRGAGQSGEGLDEVEATPVADLDHGSRVADLGRRAGDDHVHDVDRSGRAEVGVVAGAGFDDHDRRVAAGGLVQCMEAVGEATVDRRWGRSVAVGELGEAPDPGAGGVRVEVGQLGRVLPVDEHDAVRAVGAGEPVDVGPGDRSRSGGFVGGEPFEDLGDWGVAPRLVMGVGQAVGEQPVRGPEPRRIGWTAGDEPVEERGNGGVHGTGIRAFVAPKPSVSISWASRWSPVRSIRPSRSTWT